MLVSHGKLLSSHPIIITASYALLDANILADVYIHLTGGQSKFEFMTSNINSNSESDTSSVNVDLKKFPIPKIIVSKEDMLANDKRMSSINSKRDSS